MEGAQHGRSLRYSIHWILRDEGVPLDAGLSLSFDDVSQLLLLHSAEDCAPYPPCLQRHLTPVHAYLVAIRDGGLPTASEKGGEAGAAQDNATGHPCEAGTVAAAVVMGVVGVCWVDLSATPRMPANAVQGYLQVVMVRRAFRQLGVAAQLLSCLLAVRDTAAICSGSVADCLAGKASSSCRTTMPSPSSFERVGASASALAACPTGAPSRPAAPKKEANGATAVAHPITSWMLHTMSASSVATRAYLRHRRRSQVGQQRAEEAIAPKGTERSDKAGGGNPAGVGESGEEAREGPAVTRTPTALTAPPTLAAQVEDDLAAVRAVVAMYTKRGFVERRTLYRYYGNLADAVEMVRTGERALKTARP